MSPIRIRLSRRKGWRMPPNTVKVDRTTKWGNPFIIGQHGTRAHCVGLFRYLLQGHLCVSLDAAVVDAQIAYRALLRGRLHQLRGKNLACWCPLGEPCHADVLLQIANR